MARLSAHFIAQDFIQSIDEMKEHDSLLVLAELLQRVSKIASLVAKEENLKWFSHLVA